LTVDETITRPFGSTGQGSTAGGDAALIGKTLGSRYVIEAFLGAGGMGTVYAAFDAVAEHHVAVKFIRPELASSDRAGQRLRSELRTALAVTHPNVARTHTLEELDGHTFLVMERLDGPTLDERLAQGPVEFPEALALARGIVAGVDAAHARGVVHRDLKPLNVKLVPDGRPVIMDFGLAVLHLEHAASRERTGNTVVGGTPGYMAPEVIAGEIGDRRADVYALGVMLHEVFTGRRPSPGSSTSLPGWLARLLDDMVAAEPEERPIHAGEVRWRLERGEGAPPARRRRSIGFAAGVAVLAAAVGAGIVLVVVDRGHEPGAPAAAVTIPAAAATVAPPADAALPPADVAPPADAADARSPADASVVRGVAPAGKKPARAARDAGASPPPRAPDAAPPPVLAPPPPPRPVDPDAPWDPTSAPRDADPR
jgi:serine/threonine protein kinase